MANWKFWQRNKQTDNSELPEEVREYYESTRRSRTGTAFLLGLATLAVTLALAAVLYFAGRFVWEQFSNDESEAPVVTEQTEESQTENGAQNGQSEQPEEETPTQLPGDGEENANQSQETNGTSNAGGNQESSTSGDAQKGSGVSQTPDTGPGDTLAIFIGSTIIGTLAYEVIARKKQTN